MRERITQLATGSIKWPKTCNACPDIIEADEEHFYVFRNEDYDPYQGKNYDARRWHLRCMRLI